MFDSIRRLVSRRDLFRSGAIAGLAFAPRPAAAAAAGKLQLGPELYKSIGVRPVTEPSKPGTVEPVRRASSRRPPEARSVSTSTIAASPPGPSSGEAGESWTRISTMSVTGIDERS